MRSVFAMVYCAVALAPSIGAAKEMTIRVVTEIEAPSDQAGVKSSHEVVVDTDKMSIVRDAWNTGTTDIGPISLDAARPDFSISNASNDRNSLKFRMNGQVASGIRVLPDIDYELDITINRNGTIEIRGRHDAYPSYYVDVQGNDNRAYEFHHAQGLSLNEIARLLSGDADDIEVAATASHANITEPPAANRTPVTVSGGETNGGDGWNAGGIVSDPFPEQPRGGRVACAGSTIGGVTHWNCIMY